MVPFNAFLPWARGCESEVSGFASVWFLINAVMGSVLYVDPLELDHYWLDEVHVWEMVKESCYLLSTKFCEAVMLSTLETFLCGNGTRWMLAQSSGLVSAAVCQSTVVVYFMVLRLIFYLWIRPRDADNCGRARFELGDLEEALWMGDDPAVRKPIAWQR